MSEITSCRFFANSCIAPYYREPWARFESRLICLSTNSDRSAERNIVGFLWDGFCGGFVKNARPLGQKSAELAHIICLFLKDNAQQRAVHVDIAVVLYESQLSELVHKDVYAGSGSADHFRQGLL